MSLISRITQPINFIGAGYVIDFRRILGSNNQVSIFISSNEESPDKIINTLGLFAGESIEIVVKNNQLKIFEAAIFVEKSATKAEGIGTLFEQKSKKNIIQDKKLSFDIDIIKTQG